MSTSSQLPSLDLDLSLPSTSLLAAETSTDEEPGSLLKFDPSVLAFGEDGKIVGIDKEREKEKESLEEQQRRLEELRRKIRDDEERLKQLRPRVSSSTVGCFRV
jgi:septal ring factor EnvC (AmiA/AmiB activator)